jgi:serine/threonine protein kinase
MKLGHQSQVVCFTALKRVWCRGCSIALDICCGLTYLHRHGALPFHMLGTLGTVQWTLLCADHDHDPGQWGVELHSPFQQSTAAAHVSVTPNAGQPLKSPSTCGVGILHLDIKSPNILLSDNWVAKISDIGLGRTVTEDNDSASELLILTPATPLLANSSAPPNSLRTWCVECQDRLSLSRFFLRFC